MRGTFPVCCASAEAKHLPRASSKSSPSSLFTHGGLPRLFIPHPRPQAGEGNECNLESFLRLMPADSLHLINSIRSGMRHLGRNGQGLICVCRS